MATIILDTNLLFSALLRLDTPIQRILESGAYEVYLLEYATIEIFKHKEKILRYTTLAETEVYTLYHELLRLVLFFDESEISRATWEAADALCQDVDPDDTVYVAAAMSTNGFCLDRR